MGLYQESGDSWVYTNARDRRSTYSRKFSRVVLLFTAEACTPRKYHLLKLYIEQMKSEVDTLDTYLKCIFVLQNMLLNG